MTAPKETGTNGQLRCPFSILKSMLAARLTQCLWFLSAVLTPASCPKPLHPGALLPCPTFSFLYNATILAMHLVLLALGSLLASWFAWLPLGTLSFVPSILFPSLYYYPLSSHGLVQSRLFQMPLAILSLISTIETFPSSIPRSSHVLICIQPPQ